MESIGRDQLTVLKPSKRTVRIPTPVELREEEEVKRLERRYRIMDYRQRIRELEAKSRKPWSLPTVTEVLGLLDEEIEAHVQVAEARRKKIQAEKERIEREKKGHERALERTRHRAIVEADLKRRRELEEQGKDRERKQLEAQQKLEQLEQEAAIERRKKEEFRKIDLWYDREKAKIIPPEKPKPTEPPPPSPDERQGAVDALREQYEARREALEKEHAERLAKVQEEKARLEREKQEAEKRISEVKATAKEKAKEELERERMLEHEEREKGEPPREGQDPYESTEYIKAVGRYQKEYVVTHPDEIPITPEVSELLEKDLLPRRKVWREIAEKEPKA